MKLFITLIIVLLPTMAMADHGWQHGGHGGNWGNPWHHEESVPGIIGGIIGGGIINLLFPPQVVQQVPELVPQTPAWYAYCINKYKTFNPQTGTYTGFDGLQHPCT